MTENLHITGSQLISRSLRRCILPLHFGLDGLLQKRSRAVAQDLGQRLRKNSWSGELEDVSVGLGVSLVQWMSEASNTLTIRRLIL